MTDEGWVRLGDCEPGTLVESVAFGTRWLFTGFVRAADDGTGETHELYGVGSDEMLYLPPDLLVYPLTAVRLHPSLRGSDLWGLVQRWAAEPGDVTAGVLLDALADHAGREPDVAAAVREQCARECEDLAAEIVDSMELGRGSDDNPRYVGQVVGVRQCADRIRAPGRPAATAAVSAAACPTCRDYSGVGQVPLDPNLRVPNWTTCPDCGGTGHTNGG